MTRAQCEILKVLVSPGQWANSQKIFHFVDDIDIDIQSPGTRAFLTFSELFRAATI